MKSIARNIVLTSIVTLAASPFVIAQTNIQAQQANTAFREVAPSQAAAPANTWFENWYRDKFGRRPFPVEPAPSQGGPKNLISPTYRAPFVQTIARDGITNREAKRLESIAESRTDHLELAKFYTAKAANLEAQAAGYKEAAAAYRNGPTIKNLMSPTTAGRYEFIAKTMRDEAKSSHLLVASHEHMALIASR